MPEFPAEEEEVLLLLERVTEAKRISQMVLIHFKFAYPEQKPILFFCFSLLFLLIVTLCFLNVIICPNPNFNRQLKILETRGGEKEETRTMTSGDSLVLTRRNYPSGNENFFFFFFCLEAKMK